MSTSPSPSISIRVNGVEVVIDPMTLTLREQQQVKGALAKLDYPADENDMLAATIWVIMRRQDTSLTFDDVCGAITLADIAAAAPTTSDPSDPEA
jgi:hypothetical protein